MKRFSRMSLLLCVIFFFLCIYARAEIAIPAGPWNYSSGKWVQVSLPDNFSPWEWVIGHWDDRGNWVAGYWRKVEPPQGEAAVWVVGHWNALGEWVSGHWRREETVAGKHWVPGHWNNFGKWVPGKWEKNTFSEAKKIWVSGRYGPQGRWIPGRWEYR
jgi:hypothetical protein